MPPTASLSNRAPGAISGRGLDRRGAIARALELAEGLFTSFEASMLGLAAALDRQPTTPPELAAYLAARPDLAARLGQLVQVLQLVRRLHGAHKQAFTKALEQRVPELRDLELMRIDPGRLVATCEGFVEQVDAWKADPIVGPFLASARGDAPAMPKRITDLQGPGSLPDPHVAPPRPHAPAPAPEVAAAQARELVATLQRELERLRAVYTYTAGRIELLEAGVACHARPGDEPEVVCAGAAPKVVAIAGALADVYRTEPRALRDSQVAIVQTTDVRRSMFQVDQTVGRAAQVVPLQALMLARGVNLAPLRGKIALLTHFPRVFAPYPILQKVFPPR